MSDTPDLDAIDLATMKQDKVCIERDHETNALSWRFVTPKADPISMILRVFWLQMIRESGYHDRIEQLEKRVAELESLLGKGA